MNEFEKMSKGLLYNSTDRNLMLLHKKGLIGSQRLNKIPYWQTRRREHMLNRLIPSSKGKSLDVFPPFHCEYGINIYVGKECFCNFNCVFLDVAPISLGDGVWLGANVTLATPIHPYLWKERLNYEYPDGYHALEYAKPISIGNHCWICSGVTVCGGVSIGENTIISAGAVVTSNIPANCIAGGIPAKVIRMIDENDMLDVWNTYQSETLPLSSREKTKFHISTV